jgi:hypothetical protein
MQPHCARAPLSAPLFGCARRKGAAAQAAAAAVPTGGRHTMAIVMMACVIIRMTIRRSRELNHVR